MPLLSDEELEEKLAEIVRRLRAALSPVAIYFFGSYAYGTPQVYTREEFEGRVALPVSFERTIKRKGKLVYAA